MVNHVSLMRFLLSNEIIRAIKSMENELLIVNLKLACVVRREKPQRAVSIEQNICLISRISRILIVNMLI